MRERNTIHLGKLTMSGLAVQEKQATDEPERLTISLRTLAQMLDAHRSSVRRWLQQAGIRPVVLGRGRNGAIRYRWRDVQEWIASRQPAD